MALVEVDAVSKSYPRRAGLHTEEHTVVEDVSFSIEAGETLGLVGESGSGKTTVARMILGLVQPSRGAVRVDGIDVPRAGHAEMKRLRRQMQPVFQDPYAALNPRMRILDIVTEPLVIHGRAAGINTSRSSLHAKAIELLRQVGLDESALDRHPHEFSGGQRQRIALARALMLEPKVMVADEPVSALDVSVQAQVLNLLLDLKERHAMTLLFISHDLRVVEFLCDRIAVMYLGEIVEMSDKTALYRNPRHPYTQALFASAPGRPREARLAGEIPNAADIPEGCAFRSRCPRAFERCAIERPRLRALPDGAFAACHLCDAEERT